MLTCRLRRWANAGWHEVQICVTKPLKTGTTPPNELSDVLTAQMQCGATQGWVLCGANPSEPHRAVFLAQGRGGVSICRGPGAGDHFLRFLCTCHPAACTSHAHPTYWDAPWSWMLSSKLVGWRVSSAAPGHAVPPPQPPHKSGRLLWPDARSIA